MIKANKKLRYSIEVFKQCFPQQSYESPLGCYELIIKFSSEKFIRKRTGGRFMFYIHIQNYFKIRSMLGLHILKDEKQVAMHDTFLHQNE